MEGAPKQEGQERIQNAALRVKGEIFEGLMHIHAWDKLKQAHPEWVSRDIPKEQGFITSAGRFVSREEAAAIAENTAQREFGAGELHSYQYARENESKDIKSP